MGHLDTQRSLPLIGADKSGLSPLTKKLRLTADHRVALLNAPDGCLSQLKPGPRELKTALEPNKQYDGVVLFVKNVDELRRLGPVAVRAAKPGALLWIAYPKGGRTEDVTDLPATPMWVQRDVLGEITSQTGYKPVAFVAVDTMWTAMRFKKV